MAEAEDKKEEVKQSGSTTDAAVVQIREVVKWLIGAFAAVGVALAAGSQLSEIGHIDDLRLVVAFLGVFLVLVGIVVAIFCATRVLIPQAISLKELVSAKAHAEVRDAIAADPSLLLGHGSTVADLEQERDAAIVKEDEAWTAFEAKEDDKALQALAEKSSDARKRVDEAMRWLFSFARYTEVSSLFRQTLWVMTGAAVVAAIGITAFAWAAHPEDKKKDSAAVVAKAPVQVQIHLSASGRETLGDDLGDKCGTAKLSAVALAGNAEALDVVTVPTTTCSVHRFTLTDELGTFENAEPVTAPSRGPPPIKPNPEPPVG